jgi:transcriptional regulator with XRE-family HTH domain
MTDFGTRLREERNRLGMSQEEFAAISGVGLNAQGRYERGMRSPRADYLMSIAARGVDILYLLTGVQYCPPATDEEAMMLQGVRRIGADDRQAIRQIITTLAQQPSVKVPE